MKARGITPGVMGGVLYTGIQIMAAVFQYRWVVEYAGLKISGVWLVFQTIGMYVSYIDTGVLGPTLSREVALVFGRLGIDLEQKNREIAVLVKSLSVTFWITSLLIFVVGCTSGGMYFSRTSQDSKLFIAWCIFLLGSVMNLVGAPWLSTIYGFGSVATERLIRSTGLLVGLLSTYVVLKFGGGIISLAVVWVIQSGVTRGLGYFYFRRLVPIGSKSRAAFSRKIIQRLAAPAFNWALVGLGGILIFQTDDLIVSSNLGMSSVMQYDAQIKVITTMVTLSMLMTLSSNPHYSRIYASGDLPEFRKLVFKNVRYGMSFMIGLATFLLAFDKRLIDAWIGAGNFLGWPTIILLLITFILEAHHNIHGVATMATGNIPFVKVALLGSALKIVLSIFLVKRFGFFGIALGTMLAQAVTNNWYVPFYSLNWLRISRRLYFFKVICPLVALTIMCLMASEGARIFLRNYNNFTSLLLGTVICALVGGIAIYTLIMTPEERESILRWATAKWTKLL